MFRSYSHLWISLAVALFIASSATRAEAQESARPLLSAEISTVLKKGGVSAAQRRFDEIFPAQADRYSIDQPGMTALAMTSLQAGDYETGEALMAMVSRIAEAQFVNQLPEGVTPDDVGPQEIDGTQDQGQGQSEAEWREAAKARLGPTREDLGRFTGTYVDPDNPGPRAVWIWETCDGHLQLGVSWADVAALDLVSAGDRKFEARTLEDSLGGVEFELAPDGGPVALTHETGLEIPRRLTYGGPIPGGTGQCEIVLRPW